MASPTKLEPVSTFRRLVLLGSYIVTASTALVAALLIYGSIKNERELAEKLLRSAVRNSGSYFDRRDFRGFAESITNSKDFVYFRISSGDQNQEIGKKSFMSICSQERVFDFELMLCRNPEKSAQYIFLALLICSSLGLALIFLLRAMEGAIVADISLVIGNLGDTDIKLKTLDSSMKSLKYLSQNYRLNVEQQIMLAKTESKLNLQRQIVHDLKSPIMALEMVNKSKKITDPDILSLMTQSIQRLQLLAKQIKGDQSDVDTGRFDISHLNSILKNCSATVSQAGFTCDITTLPKAYVYGDQHQISRIIDNLVKNSIEAMKTNSSSIGYCNISYDSTPIYEIISIHDTGPGFSEHILKLLDSNVPATSKSSGDGIGILGAKTYLRLNQGELRIFSSPSNTRVSIYLKKINDDLIENS